MTSIPASRRARAMTFAPRSWPSRPGLATRTRILFCDWLFTGFPAVQVLETFQNICARKWHVQRNALLILARIGRGNLSRRSSGEECRGCAYIGGVEFVVQESFPRLES